MPPSSLSPSWNRVDKLKPTLAVRVGIKRQIFHGQPWYVLHDPMSNDFFRLNPVLYAFVGLFDGKRTVDEIWRMSLDRYGDDSPTQHEIIGLLSQLNMNNLLAVQLPADVQALLTRQKNRKLQHWRGQAMSILFIRIPLLNPQPLLDWLGPLFRPLLSRTGLLLWFLWMGYALFAFLPHVDQFVSDSDSILAPRNWGWMIVLFIVTKLFHELGHGLICRRLGGAVPQVGVMMLVLFPAPYVDATSSWNFPNRWHRLLVAAGGMLFEMTLAAGAALIWIYEQQHNPGSLTQQLAYNVVFLASLTTLLFNGNPLLRFDGYYMLCDLLNIANLYDRSTKHLQKIYQRYGVGLTHLPSITSKHSEAVILFLYGITSTLYRFAVLFGIFFFIVGQLYFVGVLLACWSMFAWVVLPFGKFLRWLFVEPVLHGHRVRAVCVTGIIAALGVVVVGIMPMKDYRIAQGIVQSSHTSQLIAHAPGFVTQINIPANAQVKKGDRLLVLDNPAWRTEFANMKKQTQLMENQVQAAISKGPATLALAKNRLALQRVQSQEMQRKINLLTLISPQDGTVVQLDANQMIGRYVQHGDWVAKIIDPTQLRVTALMAQDHHGPAIGDDAIEQVHLRLAGLVEYEIPTQITTMFESAHKQLPHRALGYSGGGNIATDQQDDQAMTMLRPHFELWLELPEKMFEHRLDPMLHSNKIDTPSYQPLPGQRVYVRLTMKKRKSLLALWYRQLNQLISDRVNW